MAALDSVVPVVSSESLVVTAGVLAVGGDPVLPVVIAAAALGAFSGDHASYLVGRLAGPRLATRLSRGSRNRAALDWAGGMLAARGGSIIIVCRYIPGARTAVTLTAGVTRYSLRTFSAFDALAAAMWATYAGLIGTWVARLSRTSP